MKFQIKHWGSQTFFLLKYIEINESLFIIYIYLYVIKGKFNFFLIEDKLNNIIGQHSMRELVLINTSEISNKNSGEEPHFLAKPCHNTNCLIKLN